MQTLQIIPDKKAIGISHEKHNEVIMVFTNLVKCLKEEIQEIEENFTNDGIKVEDISAFEYWQLRKELVLEEAALASRLDVYNLFKNRVKAYEEAFEHNSKICNANFDKALHTAKTLSENHPQIFEKYLTAFEKDKEEILKDQEIKNKFYLSLVPEINKYEKK